MRIAVHERALALAVERASRLCVRDVQSRRARRSRRGADRRGCRSPCAPCPRRRRRLPVRPRRDPREVAAGAEPRALPVAARGGGASCSTMSKMRASMSASSRVGKRQPDRVEVFEHHHVAVVGVACRSPSNSANHDVRDPYRELGARGRGRGALRRRPCPAVHELPLRGVERRELHERRRRNARGDRSARACARPVVPEWRSSTVTDVDVGVHRLRHPLGRELVDLEREAAHRREATRRGYCPRLVRARASQSSDRSRAPARRRGHRGVLRCRRVRRARARRRRGVARSALPRHRSDDPRLARRARQLHARRRDR